MTASGITLRAPRPRGVLLLGIGILLTAPPTTAQNARPRPAYTVVRDLRVVDREDAPRVALVLKDGRIEGVLDEGAALPAGAKVVAGEGALAVPAFIDAYSHLGCETPTPVADRDVPTDVQANVDIDMREANRKGVQAAFKSLKVFALSGEEEEALRRAGFGALVSAPHGEILSGASLLVTTRDAALRDRVVDAALFAHAGFSASGAGYPSTLMGASAQIRQFFLDARHHIALEARHRARRPGPRPPFDGDLDAAGAILRGERRVVCEAETARDIERWLRLGAEAGFDVAISGGREAWKLAEVLAARRIPVFLTLDWGEEVPDPHAQESGMGARRGPTGKIDPRWIYEEPPGVRAERRRRWEEGRDCALRLHEAGVRFAFGSGASTSKRLLRRVRELVVLGLPREVALRALTTTSAELLGVQGRLGSLAPGYDASLALWTADPLSRGAEVFMIFVDGFPHEIDLEDRPPEMSGGPPDEGVSAAGKWRFVFDAEEATVEGELALEMDADGTATGTLIAKPLGAHVPIAIEVEGQVTGSRLFLRGRFEVEGAEATLEVSGELAGDVFTGEARVVMPGSREVMSVTGERKPGAGQGGTR